MKAMMKKEAPQDWETEDHVNTLLKAEEIKGDKMKMKHAAKKLMKKKKAIESLGDLKALYKERYMTKDEDGISRDKSKEEMKEDSEEC